MSIKHLQESFRKQGISIEKITFGRGTKGPQNNHYILTTSKSYSNKEKEYVIQYCKDIKRYLAWKYGDKQRTKFTVKADDVHDRLLINNFGYVTKPIEYSGWEEEDVAIFDSESIEWFISSCLMR